MLNRKGTYIHPVTPNETFLTASKILFEAVEHTLGKDGLNTAIPTSNNYLSVINDGKTILETLSSDDKALELAINTLKESAFATNLNAGDGTTTTTVLQHILLSEVLNFNNKNKNYQITSKDIKSIRDKLLSVLPNYRKEITSEEDLSKVITVALGSDEYTDIVTKAFSYDGLSNIQRPTIIKCNDFTAVRVTNIDGVSLTPVEVNPVVLRNMPVQLDEDLNVVIIDQTISRLDHEFTKILNKIAQSDKKTILLYTEIMPSVLDQILFNIQEGSLHLIPIRLAYPQNKMSDYINDLAKYFNAPVINDLNPYQTALLNNIFGKATGYVINKDSAVIKNTNEEYVSDILPAKSSLIQVGFITYSQQEELFRRIEDAVHSAYNALCYGYTIGAGYTLMCLALELQYYPDYIQTTMKKVLSYLFNLLCKDQDQNEFASYCEENVFDSYKVTEQVILNAFTVVSQILSTRCILVPYV